MFYISRDNDFYKTVDYFFKSQFEYAQSNAIRPECIFQNWTHTVNHADLEIMFQDLQREIALEYYIPKKYRRGPIQFLNYLYKQTDCLQNYYLSPIQKFGIFRQYQIKNR